MSPEVHYADYMSGADAMMWAVECDPFMRSAGAGVLVLERAPDSELLRASVEGLVAANPRFRQIVVESSVVPSAPPRFVDDQHFNLGFHLYELGLPGEGTVRDLLDLAERLRASDFDRRRPLWEFALVTGLEGERAALVIKVHHAITDAIGGLSTIIEPLMDGAPDREAPRREAPALPQPVTSTDLVRGALEHEASGLLDLGIRLLRGTTRLVSAPQRSVAAATEAATALARSFAPGRQPLSPLMTERSLSARMDGLVVDVADVRAAGKRASGRLNDALVAGILGALGRYHDHHGTPARRLRMMMPISLRDPRAAERAGNEIAMGELILPAGLADVDERIRSVQTASERARADPSLELFGSVASVASRLPAPLVAGLYRGIASGVDFVTSNVPGPREPLYLSGARLEEFYAFGPMAMAALNVSVMSYAGKLHLGVHTDPAAVPDPELLMECLEASFAELCPPAVPQPQPVNP